jgi:ATP-binding cassette subfamily B protein/ATP-binding cassette subfamily C protein
LKKSWRRNNMASSYEKIFLEENEKNEGDLKTFKRLWKYVNKYKLILLVTFLTLAFSTVIDLVFPVVIRYGIDNVISIPYIFEKDETAEKGFVKSDNGNYELKIENDIHYMMNLTTGEKQEVEADLFINYRNENINKIYRYSMIFLFILISQLFFNYGQIFFSILLGQKVIYDLRSELYNHILNLKYSFFTKNPSGKITTRVVHDTQNLSEFFSEVLSSMLKNVAVLVGVVIIMMRLDLNLSLRVLLVLPIVIVAMYIFRIFDRKAYDKVRTRISVMNAYLAENISGSSVTKLFNQEKRKEDEFKDISTRLYKAKIQQMYVFAVFRPLINFLYFFTLSLMLWFGIPEVRGGFISLGTLYAFTSYIQMFFRPLFDIAEKYDIMQNAFSSAGKIFKLFDEKQEDLGHKKYEDFENSTIEFKNVRFSYEKDEEVLKGVSFNIEKNERVSIVGETGSGKTTTIKLLSGLYKYDEGEILIDGKELYDYDLIKLRKRIAVVPQDVFLFSGNILDNIRLFNKNIAEEEVIKAAKEVYADEVIKKLPAGYKTEILERGGTLSTGERQLIALSRAVLFNAKIIMLDEATANIDVETEHLIQKALDKISEKATIISIAHRLSTVKSSKRIIVVHKGKVVEQGKHNDLIDKKGIYYDLYKLQFENEN